jgi:hypothetical protein
MPESVVREELETRGIHVQGVLQLRSGRGDQDVARDRPMTPHFIVSVARGTETQKMRFLTELCGLRVSVDHSQYQTHSLTHSLTHTHSPQIPQSANSPDTLEPRTTRTGRHIHLPARFNT